MSNTGVLYLVTVIWLSGCISGFVMAMLLTFVGLKVRWIAIKEQ